MMKLVLPTLSLFVLLCVSTSNTAWSQSELESLFTDDLRTEFLARERSDMPADVDPLTTGAVRKREEIFKYCLNISDAATETRTAVLANRLSSMGTEVDDKLKKLDERIAVLRDWMTRRQQFLDSANDSLIKIFASMRPDAAALQFTEIGPGKAAAIISKLEPNNASAILAEMKPADAAKITLVLSSAMKVKGADK